MKYKRGEVYLVQEHGTEGHEIKKTRPWVLMGANPINAARSTVIAIPLSTQAKEIPGLSVKIYLNNTFSCAVLDQIRAVDKKRLLRLEGELSAHELELMEEGLKQILCL
jgi:mRNA interferase MazF